VLKPHNREWTQARRADDTWREAEPNLLSSAPPPGRLVAVVADLRLIPVVPDDADASQDFVFGAPVAPPNRDAKTIGLMGRDDRLSRMMPFPKRTSSDNSDFQASNLEGSRLRSRNSQTSSARSTIA
jgi:hypothetical protein